MKSIVITGSTRGIGYGLAEAFLARGCRVTVNGRSPTTVSQTIQSLEQTYGSGRVAGQAGDVSQVATHEMLWQTAVSHFSTVDIWINNAGVGHPMKMVWELPQTTINRVVDINIKGVIFGSQVAISRMAQQGHGHLYNMEGFGSNGRIRAGISVYGSSKSALRFLTRSLTAETQNTPVKVSSLSPGIVITDFLSEQYQDDPAGFERAKRIFNILGEKVETVTPWLADKVLNNNQSGASFEWLTPGKVTWKFLTARFNKRDLFR